ncbi:LAFE_0E10110g1_1 [Lachancea fermentati]|uniref:LAFE_0E10110g1_1 n=1 Tax=Lachancea fermentati TaxID=4955 RepID=A0A1G4MDF6_LACFM|nr:LAFE_0E10110g1_1 [Lachancea fermentati]
MSLAVPKPPFKVKAQYSWSGETKNDLGFLENDIIEVTKIKGNWFYGTLLRNSKKYGYFPINYVTIIQERYNNYGTPPPSTKEERKSNSSQNHFAQSRLPPIPNREIDIKMKQYDRLPSYQPRMKAGIDEYHRGSPQGVDSSLPRLRTSEKQNVSNNFQLPQSYSTSNIPSMGTRPHTSPRYSRPTQGGSNKLSKAVSSGNSSHLKNDALPPLPPIPSLDVRARHKASLPKSFSSNDLPNPSVSPIEPDTRKSYYRSSADFYDHYGLQTNSDDPSSVFSHSQYLDDSVASSEDSFALMSDFSATSAGSLARHRFARSFNDSLEKSRIGEDEGEVNRKGLASSSKFGGMFKKILARNTDSSPSTPTDDYPRLPNLASLQLSSSNNEAHGWVEAKAQLHRAQTLSSRERHERQMRALEENRDIVLHPQEYINEDINTNEVRHGRKPGLVDIELSSIDYEFINEMTKKRARKGGMHSIESFTRQVFSSAYKSHIQKLCGVFMFCTETFKLIDDNGKTNFGAEPVKLDKILHKSYCTPYELTWIFKRMSNALGIHCEIVIGFLKTPGANNLEFKFNHCWLRILVNEEWRFVDVILGNITNPIHEYINNRTPDKAEHFYFLAPPLQLIYTHIPRLYQEQHIIPVIDQNIALCLPVVFPSFFKNELKLFRFSNGLLKMLDTQIFECSLLIPNDVELFSAVVVEGKDCDKYKGLDLSLVQIRHRKKERIAIIKAVLPVGASKGMLHIHSGVRGAQTTVANIHPLSLIIPLEHSGLEKDYEFVVRTPSKTVQKIEMYIKKPQNKYLVSGHEYTFQVIQSPCDGVVYGSGGFGKSFRQELALQSPSGKIYLLKKNDPNFDFGTWESTLTLNEPGLWIGLVTSDTGAGWCSYAKWWCI